MRKTGGVAIGALGIGALNGGVSASTAEPSISVGERVTPIVPTETYALPDPSSASMGVARTADGGYVRGGPSEYDGRNYWLVDYTDGPRGWTSETNVEVATPVSGPPEAVLGGVPYYNQYRDNELNPAATCQNTAIAMVLNYYGWGGIPDDITARHGSQRAQTPDGGQAVFNDHGSDVDVTATGRRQATVAEMEALVDEGVPVIVYGWFLGNGHVVVLLGHDGGYYYCNDSGGEWNERYRYDGDFLSRDGEYVRYRKRPFLDAVVENDTVWLVAPDE